MAALPFDPAAARYVSLATFRRDGTEVLTPVWIAGDAGRWYVFSAGKVGKVKRIRATPRARIAPCDGRGKLRGPWLALGARIVEDAATLERGYRALRAKYGWQMAMLDFFSTLSGKKQQRALIELHID